MERLNRKNLARLSPESHNFDYPVRVMQFGEGNFLRAFIDWMIDISNEQGLFNGMVQLVQPIPQGTADLINEQDGLYTLFLRGVENGKPVERKRVISSVKGCFKPDVDWTKILETAKSADLRFIFSNTTEAGIEYKPEAYTPGVMQTTYPAKLTAILYARYQAKQKGLIIIPCELINHNGATLKKYILQYAADWKLDAGFAKYVENDCVFFCTLVDRIVAGYPRANAKEMCEKLGYEDNLLDCAEVFHLFVIEGDEKYAAELPFNRAGLHVVWTRDQSPYRTRKVRFLNGGHTSSVLAAYQAGFDFVDKMTSDALFGKYLRKALFEEVFPTVALPDDEKKAFAESIIERFLNPYANHQLISISLNSISKWQVRVLPSLLDYLKINGKLPEILTFSLAALLTFYRGTLKDGKYAGTRAKGEYPINDDVEKIKFINDMFDKFAGNDAEFVRSVLSRTDFWGQDLTAVAGLADATAANLKLIREKGILDAVKTVVGD